MLNFSISSLSVAHNYVSPLFSGPKRLSISKSTFSNSFTPTFYQISNLNAKTTNFRHILSSAIRVDRNNIITQTYHKRQVFSYYKDMLLLASCIFYDISGDNSGAAMYIDSPQCDLYLTQCSFSRCETQNKFADGLIFAEVMSVYIENTCSRNCHIGGRGSFIFSKFQNSSSNLHVSNCSFIDDFATSAQFCVLGGSNLTIEYCNSTKSQISTNSLLYTDGIQKTMLLYSYISQQKCQSIIYSATSSKFTIDSTSFNHIQATYVIDGECNAEFSHCSFFDVKAEVSNISDTAIVFKSCFIDDKLKPGLVSFANPSKITREKVFASNIFNVAKCHTGPTETPPTIKPDPTRTRPVTEAEKKKIAKPAVRNGVISLSVLLPIVLIAAALVALIVVRYRMNIDNYVRAFNAHA